ncbi:hypothetical protein HMPREF2528_08605 [Rothia sp. HMSC078H08]|nr:hypothetical protein HMPREF2528_08605 [Rothia sp. HMSC078H08]
MSTYAAVSWLLVLAGNGRGLDKDGFALTLAGECPLFSAWGRFEDGAPAPHEHFRRCEVPTPRMGRHRGWSPAPRECLRYGRFRTANDEL